LSFLLSLKSSLLNLSYKKILFFILSFDLLALIYGSSSLSIGADEARAFYLQDSFASFLAKLSVLALGQNDFALRLPFLILHFLSCLLLYALALKTLKRQKDALFSLLLFILLPATPASAILLNNASLMIFLSLAIICAYEYDKKWLFYTLLILAFFVEKSFFILYLALFIYGFYKKDFFMLGFNLAFLALSLYIYGYESSGKPKSYFLETLGVFVACFSPLVFAYFFYVIYRL